MSCRPRAGRLRRAGFALAGLSAVLLACPAQAVDGLVGLGVGHSTRDRHAFGALELIFPIDSPLRLNLNLEYLRKNDVRQYTTGLDVLYFATLRPIDARLTGWVGAGFGVVTRDPVGPVASTTHDGRFDVLGGVSWDGEVAPFVQVKFAAKKPAYLFGLRFAF